MADIAPALADRARRMRSAGRRIKDIAAELGISIWDVKKATTDGFAEHQRERWREQDDRRKEQRKEAFRVYSKDYYERTKHLRIADAKSLAAALIERRRQRGIDQATAAKEFGKTLSVYQRWEAGVCPLSDIRLVRLALRGLETGLTPRFDSDPRSPTGATRGE